MGCKLKYYREGTVIYYRCSVVSGDCSSYMKCLFRVYYFINIIGRNKANGGLKQCTFPVNDIVLRT